MRVTRNVHFRRFFFKDLRKNNSHEKERIFVTSSNRHGLFERTWFWGGGERSHLPLTILLLSPSTMCNSPSAELMSWKSISFILSTPFYEMLLDLEQESCGDTRWILPLWGLPQALYHEHFSECEYHSVPSEIIFHMSWGYKGKYWRIKRLDKCRILRISSRNITLYNTSRNLNEVWRDCLVKALDTVRHLTKQGPSSSSWM